MFWRRSTPRTFAWAFVLARPNVVAKTNENENVLLTKLKRVSFY